MFIHRDIIIIVGETPYFWTALINDQQRTTEFFYHQKLLFSNLISNELNILAKSGPITVKNDVTVCAIGLLIASHSDGKFAFPSFDV